MRLGSKVEIESLGWPQLRRLHGWSVATPDAIDSRISDSPAASNGHLRASKGLEHVRSLTCQQFLVRPFELHLWRLLEAFHFEATENAVPDHVRISGLHVLINLKITPLIVLYIISFHSYNLPSISCSNSLILYLASSKACCYYAIVPASSEL